MRKSGIAYPSARRLNAFLVFALLCAGLGSAGSAAAQEEVQPPAKPQLEVDESTAAPTPGPEATAGGTFFAEFSEPLSGPDREKLADFGVLFAQAIPPSTYVVRLQPDAAAVLASHPSYLGLTPFEAIGAAAGQAPPGARGGEAETEAVVEFFEDVALADALAAAARAGVTVPEPDAFLFGERLVVTATGAQLSTFASDSTVFSVSDAPTAPITYNSVAQAMHNIDDVQAAGTTGAGVKLGIWDGGPVFEHGDLTGRVNVREGTGSDFHATHVAGTIMGSGAGDAQAEGMAPGVSSIESYDFDGDPATEMVSADNLYGIVASNHSWGHEGGARSIGCTGTPLLCYWTWHGETVFGQYDSTARAWDNVVRDTGQIVVKAAGNDGNDCKPVNDVWYQSSPPYDTTGDCDGFLDNGFYYDNITTMGVAKNVITVGALNDFGVTLSYFSSVGPADDGRIKPDVVANGSGLYSTWNGAAAAGCAAGVTYCPLSGTSMAAPVVTGTVALMEEWYRSIYGRDMPADLAKATLVNTAVDLGRVGPDYVYGYGRVDALAARNALWWDFAQNSTVDTGDSSVRTIAVDGTEPLKVTLNWIDPAGVADTGDNDTSSDLVNNLDLVLIDPSGGLHYAFTGPGRANPSGLATNTTFNTIDNVEQVVVNSPAAGNWTVLVLGAGVVDGPQKFALATSEPFVECATDDVHEENDTAATATHVVSSVGISAMRCDDDWYEIPVVAGAPIDVNAYFTHGAGDIDLSLHTPVSAGSAAILVSNGVDDDDESLSYSSAAFGGVWSVRVFGDSDNAYDLVVTSPRCLPDDPFEPNDVLAEATPLTSGVERWAVACSNNDDYYSISAGVGATITADVAFIDEDGDIDLRLFDPSGAQVASAGSTTDDETISYVTAVAGEYTLRVYGYNGAENVYGVTMTAALCPFDDALEPNDSVATATALSSGVTMSAIRCGGDWDVFSIPATVGDVIDIDLQFSHAEGNLDIHFNGPSGTIGFLTTLSDNEALEWVAQETGTYTVEVYGTPFATAEATYDLTVTASLCPPDDQYEPNNTQATATPLANGVEIDAIACSGDWYSIPAVVGDTVTALVEFAHADGDLTIALYDPTGAQKTFSNSSTDDESLSHVAALDGDYALVLYRQGAAPTNRYSLTMSTSPCPTDDGFENNDTQGAATALTPDVPVDAMVCAGDFDWYEIPAVAGQLVTAVSDFTHADGNIDILLFTPSGSLVDSSESFADGEAVTHTAAATGNYALRVHGENGAENAYSVSMKAGAHPLIRPFGAVANPEGDSGSQIVDLVLYLEDENGQPTTSPTPVTVSWLTSDVPSNPNVAHPGEDFVAGSGIATFLPGQSQTSVPLEVLGDTIDEPPILYGEWGLWTVNNQSSNAKIDTASFWGIGLVIIVDDD